MLECLSVLSLLSWLVVSVLALVWVALTLGKRYTRVELQVEHRLLGRVNLTIEK